MFSLLEIIVSPECLCQPHWCWSPADRFLGNSAYSSMLLVVGKLKLLGVKSKLQCKSSPPPPREEGGENKSDRSDQKY